MAVVLHTTHGDLPVLLHFRECPKAAFNFLALCASNYYDNCAFLRYFPNTLLQTGDPTNTGKGGEAIFAKIPETHFQEERECNSIANVATTNGNNVTDINKNNDDISSGGINSIVGAVEKSCYFDDEGFGVTLHTQRGVLSMAHKGSKPNTNASQFLILCSPQPSLDGLYTAFGQVDLTGKYIASSHTVWHDKTNKSTTRGSHTCNNWQEIHDQTNITQENANVKTGDEVLQALQHAAEMLGTDSKHRIKQAQHVASSTNCDNTLQTQKGELAILGTTILYNPFAEGHIRL